MWLSRALKAPLTGVGILVGQVLYAAHRPDMPGLENQDPSGVFGGDDAPQLRIVVLGDSSVTAPGVHPLDAAWPRRMAHSLADRYRIEMVSVAVGGAKARDVLADQLPRALESGADIALISAGANDALRATPALRFEKEIDEILAQLSAVVEGIGISGLGDLGTLRRLPTLARGVARVRGRSFDDAILRAASRHPSVVKASAWGPQWRFFEDGDPDIVFAEDQFHASAHGHAVFAAAFAPVMAELLARRTGTEQRRSG
jgi:lysophospholipase L1-like esterase